MTEIPNVEELRAAAARADALKRDERSDTVALMAAILKAADQIVTAIYQAAPDGTEVCIYSDEELVAAARDLLDEVRGRTP